MRTRKEIEESIKDVTEPYISKYDKAILEVLLDIRTMMYLKHRYNKKQISDYDKDAEV